MAWRLLLDGAMRPAWNMAVDEALLRAGGPPTLRLYAWDPPALSLGYFQPFAGATPRDGESVVRRITGGGAVRHADEVTYSLACPAGAVGDGTRKGAYRAVHAGVARALAEFGVHARRPALAAAIDGGAPRGDHGLCFAKLTELDLEAGGRKIAGSAQRRIRTPDGPRLLQHGSIPLTGDAGGGTSAEGAGGASPPWDEAARAIARGIGAALEVELADGGLDEAERARAAELERDRYGTEAWTRLR